MKGKYYFSIGYIPFWKRAISLNEKHQWFFKATNKRVFGIDRHIFICLLGIAIIIRLPLKCKHKPTGNYQIRNGKSYAECKKCGWYETTLIN